jgi:multiple sugar transport system permease protein
MKRWTLRSVTAEAKLLLIGIPVFLWTVIPVYHMFIFAISERESATSGRLWPKNPTLQNFETVFLQNHFYLSHFWQQLGNSLVIAIAVGLITLIVATTAAFAISRLRVRGGRTVLNMALFTYFIPADVQDDGQLWAAQQPVVADPGDGHHRLALLHLGAQAGVRQAAL